ncbi:MAG: tRNA (N6-isopentenyl adenosine(37)-C2)-methylthiotransferase MiaB [Immundisolibacteraceae bacterium]|nr:tRNA (N6-isopentenyl adenosine(37)-C2)-methylthiotransferase MiaB [Immundisolibacteraceae bacterium]
MSRKLFIQTHGCQMNVYDSDRIAEVLARSHDLQVTEDMEQADVLLMNTCSIREKAQEKVFSQLGRWQQLKNKRPELVLGVGGCVASQEGDAILKRAPYVDLIFGPQTLHRLPALLNQVEGRRQPITDISFPEIEKFDHLPTPVAKGVSAFVSIMEGCSKYCSFCVVPYTRGEEFSRPLADVLTEVALFAQQGVREVNLLGQNVNAYQGARSEGGDADLALLMEYIAEIEGVDRIRFTTSHPLEFGPSLVKVYDQVPQLVDHLHLPVQSGSDRILKAMKRGHNAEWYERLIEQIRQRRPNISLSSDFIVGFPGETDEDFEQTMALIERVGFDQSFSFIYSARPGTPAADLADEVPLAVKKARLARLQARITEMATAISDGMVGTVQRVLVDRLAKKGVGQLAARTENNRVVNFDGDPALIGGFVDLLITEALPNSLRGELAGPDRRYKPRQVVKEQGLLQPLNGFKSDPNDQEVVR